MPLETRLKRYRLATLVLAVVCLFLLICTLAQFGSGKSSDTANKQGQSSSTKHGDRNDAPMVRREKDDPMALGDVDAPVVLVEYTDMRCPFCAAFGRDTFPKIVDEYVDKGLVRVEMRDVAYFGEQSTQAAVAARAAGDQGKYFDYLHTVFEAAPESGHPDLPKEKLVSFAKKSGVKDIGAFTAALDDESTAQTVNQGNAEAQQTGVTGVPFFVVGDKSVSGAQPIDTFRSLLDDALKDAGATPPGK